MTRGRQCQVFERSRVTKITFTRTDATVHVEKRAIRASRVVICTDAPGALAPTLDRHVRAIGALPRADRADAGGDAQGYGLARSSPATSAPFFATVPPPTAGCC